ncbi:MAG: hypothetical protein H8Z69_03580 [Nanohaloarchaea archaeon]|nr:hypothetical protein [Candidatus Nanohaloarchaea archaeon]
MVDRKVDWKYLILAVLSTALVFSVILAAGITLQDYKTAELRESIKQIEVEQRSQSLSLQLAEEAKSSECRAMENWIDTSKPEIEELRKKVAAHERSSKFKASDYQTLKKRYMNLLVQNLIEVRTLEKSCDSKMVDVIYLYTKKDCGACEDQGTVLTYLRDEYEDKLAVYPLDTDLDMKHINFVQKYHNVSSYPALIIEGEVYRGFQSKEELENVISNQVNATEPTNRSTENIREILNSTRDNLTSNTTGEENGTE